MTPIAMRAYNSALFATSFRPPCSTLPSCMPTGATSGHQTPRSRVACHAATPPPAGSQPSSDPTPSTSSAGPQPTRQQARPRPTAAPLQRPRATQQGRGKARDTDPSLSSQGQGQGQGQGKVTRPDTAARPRRPSGKASAPLAGAGSGAGPGRAPQQPRQVAVEQVPQYAEEEEEEEEGGEEGEEGEAAEFSVEEAERLIFGDKDFTKGGPAPIDPAVLTQQSRDALSQLQLPSEAVELLMSLRNQGRVPEDPEGLATKAKAVIKASGSADQVMVAVERLALALALAGPAGSGASPPAGAGAAPEPMAGPGAMQGAQAAGWRPKQEDVAAAAVAAPRVLTMPAAAVQQRVKELEALIKVAPRRARELCCSSPALLLVPKAALEAKLKALKMATGLDAEACAGMLSVHMFPDLRLE